MNLLTTAAREAVRAGVTAAPNQVAAVGNARLTQMLGAGNHSGGVTCTPNGAGVCGPGLAGDGHRFHELQYRGP